MPTYILISDKKSAAISLVRKGQPQAGATFCRVGGKRRRSGVVFEATEAEIEAAADSVPKHARLVECDAAGRPKEADAQVSADELEGLLLYAVLEQAGINPEKPGEVRELFEQLLAKQAEKSSGAAQPVAQKVDAPEPDAGFEVGSQLLDGGGYRTVLATAKALGLGDGNTKADAQALLTQFGENPAFKAKLAEAFGG